MIFIARNGIFFGLIVGPDDAKHDRFFRITLWCRGLGLFMDYAWLLVFRTTCRSRKKICSIKIDLAVPSSAVTRFTRSSRTLTRTSSPALSRRKNRAGRAAPRLSATICAVAKLPLHRIGLLGCEQARLALRVAESAISPPRHRNDQAAARKREEDVQC